MTNGYVVDHTTVQVTTQTEDLYPSHFYVVLFASSPTTRPLVYGP